MYKSHNRLSFQSDKDREDLYKSLKQRLLIDQLYVERELHVMHYFVLTMVYIPIGSNIIVSLSKPSVHLYIDKWLFFLFPTYHTQEHGCQNPNLDPPVLWFYDPTYSKQSESFKDFCDRSGLVGSYDSDNPKRSRLLVIFFNFIEGLVGPKWKIKSQLTKFFHSNVERVSIGTK